jgi:cytochrome b561
MTLRNTTNSWGTIARAFHWVIVLMILTQWLIAERADDLPLGAAKLQALYWHKALGMTVLMLAVLRLLWRFVNPTPELASVTKPWEHRLAQVSHFLLYGLMFAMPLTGWLMSSARNFPVSWFKLFTFPDLIGPGKEAFERFHDLHELLFKVLVVVAALHVAGALKHHFLDRNDVLRRMLPFGRVK